MRTAHRRARQLGSIAVTAVLLAGCGSSSAPSDAVPALGDSLERVDDAIVDGRYDDARSELEELVGTTTNARDNGDLETAEADRILAAAAQVMSALPAEEPEPSEPADPEPAPEDTGGEDTGDGGTGEEDTGGDTSDEDAEKEQEELEKEQEKLEKEQEKLEEEADKGDEGNGNGGSSENGPDDGEGN